MACYTWLKLILLCLRGFSTFARLSTRVPAIVHTTLWHSRTQLSSTKKKNIAYKLNWDTTSVTLEPQMKKKKLEREESSALRVDNEPVPRACSRACVCVSAQTRKAHEAFYGLLSCTALHLHVQISCLFVSLAIHVQSLASFFISFSFFNYCRATLANISALFF